MFANTITSCDWGSAKALMADIDTEKLNVTELVAQCNNVCKVAFESNRNEIFGQGIMISMYIEVVLFTIFGVSFPAIVWFLNKQSKSKVAPVTILLRKIQALVLKTTAFLMLTLYVTAFHTSRQASNLSVLEITFLSGLLDFQFWCIIGTLITHGADERLNKVKGSYLLQLAYYALFIIQLAISNSIKVPHQDVYKTLAKECHEQRQFINAVSTVSGLDAAASAKWGFIGAALGFLIMLLIVFAVVYIKNIPSFLTRPFEILWNSVPAWLKRYWDLCSNTWMMAMYAFLIPSNFSRLQNVRKLALQMMPAGEEEWGYGQTTAILLWLPLVLSAIKETTKYMMEGHQREDPQAEMGFEDKKKSLPPPPPPPYDYPHPAAISTATPEVDSTDSVSTATSDVSSTDSQTDGPRRTSSGLRTSTEQSVTDVEQTS